MVGQPSPTAEPEPHTRKERLLVVEDEESLAVGIRDALERSGYYVDLALDGASALEAARAGEYDLVLLDLMLPGLSGLEVLKVLRRERSDVRVVVITAKGDEKDVVAGL